MEHLDFVENDASLRALIIASAKKSIFIAGADLKDAVTTGAVRRDVCIYCGRAANLQPARESKNSTIAAIHGRKVRAAGTKLPSRAIIRSRLMIRRQGVGLPETTLGLIPAWGGCTRLPRLIGAEKAAEVNLKGKLYSAQKLLKLGLVDEIAPRDQLIDRAREKLRAGKRKLEGGAPATPSSLAPPRQHGNAARQNVLAKSSNALLAISPDESLRMELDTIVDLGKNGVDAESDSQFLLGGKIQERASRAPSERVVHAAVIGAGVMGSGYRAMAKLSRRDCNSARYRARTDRPRFSEY